MTAIYGLLSRNALSSESPSRCRLAPDVLLSHRVSVQTGRSQSNVQMLFNFCFYKTLVLSRVSRERMTFVVLAVDGLNGLYTHTICLEGKCKRGGEEKKKRQRIMKLWPEDVLLSH